LFSEKIVVKEFLDGLTGASQKFFVRSGRADGGNSSTGSGAATLQGYILPQPRDALQVTSVYYKWMSEGK
jgi:hypothetical protein